MKWLLLAALVIVLPLLWIRFAPASVERWHDAANPDDSIQRQGYRKLLELPIPADQALLLLHEQALATPRTKVFAGSPEAGKVTYVTRSLVLGAPDYTTVEAESRGTGSLLKTYGRLRFGRGDLGVNRKRIKSWLQVFHTVQQ